MKVANACVTCRDALCVKKVSLFESLPQNILSIVANSIEQQHYLKGDTIFSEGDVADRLYIVNGGSLKVFHSSIDGHENIMYVLTEGDYIGDLNLLKKDVFSFNAVALEDTYLCTIEKDTFDKLMKRHPEMTFSILENAYDRITTLENTVQTLTTKDVDAKIAVLLIRLADSFGFQKTEGIEIRLDLTREELASFVGLTRETVSRKLSLFQSEGLIKLEKNRNIMIKRYDMLKKLSEL